MTPRRESSQFRAQEKHLVEIQELEARRKAMYDTSTFESLEEYAYLFSNRKVVSGRNIDFIQLRDFVF